MKKITFKVTNKLFVKLKKIKRVMKLHIWDDLIVRFANLYSFNGGKK